jgi:hypothetical protein
MPACGQETASRLASGEFWIGALLHDRPFRVSIRDGRSG